VLFQKGAVTVTGLFAVAADSFHRAACEGFFGQLALVVGFRLFEDVGVAAVIVTLEVGRCGLAAQVAVNALVVHVVGTRGVLRIFVFCVSHVESLLILNFFGSDK
jgi:hypothetical protein